MARRAGQDAPHRHGPRAHHRGRRDQEPARPRQALSRVGRPPQPEARRPRGRRRGRARRSRRPRARPGAAARLRPHPGGRRPHSRADGQKGNGARGQHGQRRLAPGPLEEVQAALPLLQAALCSGDEPADRSDPRGARHEPHQLHRSEAQRARRQRRGADEAHRGLAARPYGRGDAQAPLDFRLHLGQGEEQGDRHHLSRRLGQRGRRGLPRGPVRSGRRRDQARSHDPHPLRRGGLEGPRGDSRAPGDLGPSSAPDRRGPAHDDGPRGELGLRD